MFQQFGKQLLVRWCAAILGVALAVNLPCRLAQALEAGFSDQDITPDTKAKKPVWLAGYGMGRRATGVHDPLMARIAVLREGDKTIAMVSVDLIGLQYDEVLRIRAKLPELTYVMVASTHNHEGPDVIGIWGRGPFSRGVDDNYIELVVNQVVKGVKEAVAKLQPVSARFGTAEDESLLNDSRQPQVKDGVLRVVRLSSVAANGSPEKNVGLIVQWNCHPEALGSRNTLVTADFVSTTVNELAKTHQCPVVLFSGAIGGLLAPPRGDRIKAADGTVLKEGDYAYSEAYGHEVALLANKAIESAQPLSLAPFAIASQEVYLPVKNVLYRAARVAGVLKRQAYVWTGDHTKRGEPITMEMIEVPSSVPTEVACIQLGEFCLACIPGELYPELVYGKFQLPQDKNADFQGAPLEPTIEGLLQGKKWMMIGLANDEVGYIIPKSQWDAEPPYAYGRQERQYGEINSCGPEAAPILMNTLSLQVKKLAEKQ